MSFDSGTWSASTLRKRVEAVLREDLPGMLEALAAQEDLPLPAPRWWRRLGDFTLLPEAQSPAVVVTTPGIDGDPTTRRRGLVEADWLVRVFVVVRGRDYEETADRVAAYVAAARTVLLSRPSLGGIAAGVQWVAEAYAELDTDDTRTIGAGSVTVRYLGIATATATAAAPIPGDPSAPLVESVVSPVTARPVP